MRKMSERQRRILQYLEQFIREHGYPPSIRQIQSTLGLSSTSVVDYNLKLLQKHGLLERKPRSSRSIRLSGKGAAVVPSGRSVLLLGNIAAGRPIPAPEDAAEVSASEDAERVALPGDLWPDSTESLYALRVEGDSMMDAFIRDGDIVILQQQRTAHNGEMVAAWLPDQHEITLKRFYREGKRVRLVPENPAMEPITVDARSVQIQGRVIGVIRRYELSIPA